jgi:hypothetical protein
MAQKSGYNISNLLASIFVLHHSHLDELAESPVRSFSVTPVKALIQRAQYVINSWTPAFT